jgi:hypothetical protein
MDFNQDQGHVAGMIRRSMETNEAAQSVLDNAKTGGDWGSFTSNMNIFDGAVDKFAKAVASMPGATTDDGKKEDSGFFNWFNSKTKAHAAGG